MLYYLFKFLMRLTLTAFYRNRRLTGFENIPAKGPVIFACNHPNSFLDAMIIGAHIKRETHYLARSDVFNSPWKLWILSQFKLMPIYRLQEGVENLDKNKDTFEKCHAIFRKGGAVLMFSEGLCIQEMRLRPLKKGTARIALEYSKDGSPLTIIPTGLNYMKPTMFREDVLVDMDQPFDATEFAAEYNDNNSKGIQSFNKRLVAGFQRAVIDIRDKQKEKEIEQLIEVEYNNGADLKKLVYIVRQVNDLQKTDENAYHKMTRSLADYRALLASQKLSDEAVTGKSSSILLAIPSTLAFGLAFWLYLLPVGGAVTLVSNKVKLVEFKDSVLLGLSAVLVLVYWLIAFTIVSITISILMGVELMLIFLLFGLLAGPAYDVMAGVRSANVFKNNPEKEKLEKQRKAINEISSSVLDFVKPHEAHYPVG